MPLIVPNAIASAASAAVENPKSSNCIRPASLGDNFAAPNCRTITKNDSRI